MPSLTKPSLMETTDDQKQAILEMRTQFQTIYDSNPDLFYMKDLEMLNTNDWEVHRFLLAADGDKTAGLNRLTAAMKWRKQWAVRDMRETDFPKEFYQMLCFGRARNGSTLVVSRSQFYIPLNEWRDLFKKFFIFVLEWLDKQNTGTGMTLLVDLSDTGLFNVDFDFIWFLKPIQGKYFPFLLKLQLNCDIPWILNSVAQLVLSLMPEKTRKLMHFVKSSQLTDFVPEDNIPCYLGGTELQNYSWIPSECVCAEEVAKRLDFSKKNLKKLVSHLRPLLQMSSKKKNV